MKKLAFLFAAVVAVSFASCGNTTAVETCDTACCADTAAVDTVAAPVAE